MSIYTLTGEPAITAPAETNLFLAAGANGVAGTVTGAVMRQFVSNGLVALTAASPTITAASHAGRTMTIDRAAGMAITLPAATGTGNIYRFIVIATTAGTTTVKVPAASTDIMTGTAVLFADSGDTMVGFATAADTDTITLYAASNTTGGIKGARLTLQDVATGLWHVDYISDAGGSEATPFSATV